MKLAQVSRYFDRSPVTDPSTGEILFRAQFTNYDGSKRDAFTAYRRIMSVSPDVATPTKRVVRAFGEVWIVGDGHPDGWAEMHRRKFVVHRAGGIAKIWSASAYLAGTGQVNTWGDIQWVADKAEEEVSSAAPQLYTAILPDVHEAPPHSVIEVGSDILFVQSAAHHASGFLEARGYLQPAGRTTLSVVTRVFDPATGGYTDQAQSSISTLKVRWQELYQYSDQLDARYQEGDATFLVPSGTSVDTSTKFVHGGQNWTVLAVKSISGVKAVHGRPA